MKISHIECENIKSFKKLSIDLIDFNVIIGLNGSGKSNFILLFKFIKDILSTSLKKAIKNQGGANHLRNYYEQNDNATIRLSYSLDLFSELISKININDKEYEIRITKIDSDFEFAVIGEGDFKIINDSLKINVEYSDNKVKIGSSEIEIIRNNDKYSFKLNNYDAIDYELKELFANIEEIKNKKYPSDEIIINSIFEDLFGIKLKESSAKQISIYEFEQDLLSEIKFNSLISEEKETSFHYTKLLFSVLNDENKRRQFFNLLSFVLPDYEDVKVQLNADSDHRIMVKERFYNRYIPANLLSNGTVFLIVIILSLYFDEKYLTIFDEPERTIHPNVISKVVDMMKDVSSFKQIILSTHNPEIVKFSDIKNILLIYRDEEGYSQISRPTNSITVSTFLNNDIGLDELFIQNML